MRTISFIFLFLLLLVASSAIAERRNHPQFEIEIASTDSTHPYGVIMGTTIKVPIIVNKATHKISGFDFTIAYDQSVFNLLEVKPGSYLEQNSWEEFYHDFWLDNIIIDGSEYAVAYIHGAIGDSGPETPPANFKLGDTLAVLNFHISADFTLECTSNPISFIWGSCYSNKIYSWPDEKSYYSKDVISHNDSVITDYKPYPSFTGANEDCINSGTPRRPGFNKRAINYKNGRVKIVCVQDIDDRCWYGDFNSNGVDNEIADFVYFQNIYFSYFLNLLPPSSIDSACLTRIADADGDGEYLTIEDFVYYIRYFCGNSLPIDQIANRFIRGNLKVRDVDNKVTVNSRFEMDAGAVHLCFYAPGDVSNIALSEAVSHMAMQHSHINDSLKILIYSFGAVLIGCDSLNIPGNLLELVSFEYTGEKPILTYASAAGYNGEKVDLRIVENDPFSIKIGKLERVIQGTNVSIPVTKISGISEMYSFDFLISYNNSALTFLGAKENSELFDIPGEYEWEYFTYSFDENRPCDNGCPSGLIRFVGIANQKSSTHFPKSFDIADNTTLFTINFYLTSNLTYKGEFLPVGFFWKDCTDNVIRCKGAPGNPFGTRSQMALSNRVFNVESRYDNIFYEITDKKCDFPTLNGTQEECYGRVNSRRLDYVPYIDFYNGGMKIPSCVWDERGDINLNGIDYEVADAVVFTNYFIIGLNAFTVNVDAQTTITDVNGDGIPLTIEDLVHLIRVIVGDVLPYADPRPVEYFSGELHLEDNENTITVSGEFEKEVGAIHLCFYAPGQIDDVKLTDAANHMTIRYAQNNDSLKILIYSMEHRALSPDLNNYINIDYTGDKPVLACASVAGHKSEKVILRCYYDPTDNQIETTLPEKFALYQNYPNPFNPYTEIKFNLPRSSNVTLDIYDITGRKVRTLINRKLSSGSHSVIWNGRNGTGRELSTGIYLYRLSTENCSDTKKMLLLK